VAVLVPCHNLRESGSFFYVLRNQLVHSGSTRNSGVNRAQVCDGAAILAFLMPVFVDLMMEDPHEDWGRPAYPVAE
jgi:hypothetical protein